MRGSNIKEVGYERDTRQHSLRLESRAATLFGRKSLGLATRKNARKQAPNDNLGSTFKYPTTLLRVQVTQHGLHVYPGVDGHPVRSSPIVSSSQCNLSSWPPSNNVHSSLLSGSVKGVCVSSILCSCRLDGTYVPTGIATLTYPLHINEQVHRALRISGQPTRREDDIIQPLALPFARRLVRGSTNSRMRVKSIQPKRKPRLNTQTHYMSCEGHKGQSDISSSKNRHRNTLSA